MRSAVANETEIDRRVKKAMRKMAPDVIHIRYELRSNSSDQDSIFFRVVLSDEASSEANLPEVARRVREELRKSIDFSQFGLFTYFSFRSLSEQNELKEPAWS
jgi:hypothetical protein